MRFLPHWRKATWAVVIWTVLMWVWIIGGGSSAAGTDTSSCSADLQEACHAAVGVGTSIGVAMLFMLWFIGFVVLSLVWLMSRPSRRLCPVCGEQVKKGLTVCLKCKYDFAAAAAAAPRAS